MSLFGAIPAGDLTILRSGAGACWDYLTVAPPVPVLTAQIAGPLTEDDFPRAHLDIDNVAGNLADVKPGMDVWIGATPGDHDVWVGRVRKAPVAGTLYISELGHGDPGLARSVHRRAAEDQHVTVVQTMSLWYAFPRILVSGGQGAIYRDWDDAYVDQGSKPPPVAVIRFTINGLPYQHAAAFVDPATGLLTVAADASDSFPVAPGVSIAGYLWTLPPQATLVEGALTSQSLTFTVPPGRYWIECQVTDGNGKTGTARRFLAAHTRTGTHAPLALLTVSANGDRKGWTATAQVPAASADLAEVPHGAFVLLWSELAFGGTPCASAAHTLAGWCVRESTGHGARYPTTEFEVAGPGPLLDLVPAAPQRVEVATSPAHWNQVRSGLCNIPGVTWWLLRWFTNALTLFDLRMMQHSGEDWDDTRQEGFGGQALGAPHLGGQLAGVVGTIRANFGSVSDGTFRLERNPCYRDNRTSWPVRLVLEAGDIDADMPSAAGVRANSREHRLRVGVTQADGLTFASGRSVPLRALAPDWTPAQAPGRDDLEGLAVQSQGELNALAGHHFAYVNNPLPNMDVPLARMLDVFEPADMAFVGLRVTAAQFADPVHGRAWRRLLGLRADPGADRTLNLLIQSVMLERQGTTLRVRLRAEGETRGDPGRTVPIQQPGQTAEPTPARKGLSGPAVPDAVSVDYSGEGERAQTDDDVVYVFVETPGSPSTLRVFRSTNFISGPAYAHVGTVPNPGAGAALSDAILDPTDPGKAFCVNDTGLYECPDLGATPQTWNFKSTVKAGIRLLASAYRANWLAYSEFRHQMPFSLNDFLFSVNRGASWTRVNISVIPVVTFDPDLAPGVDVDKGGGGRLYQAVVINDNGSAAFRIAAATGWGERTEDWAVGGLQVGVSECARALHIPTLTPGGSLNSAALYALADVPGEGLYQTLDGFTTVTRLRDAVGQVAASVRDGNYLAGASAGDGVVLSKDGGLSWSLEPGTGADLWPRARKTLTICGTGVLKHSTDWGRTWADKEGNLTALVGAPNWVCKKVIVAPS